MPVPATPRRWRRQLLLAAKEATYGTATARPGNAAGIAAAAVDALDLDIRPLVAETTIERRPVRPHLGAAGNRLVGQHVVISWAVELQSRDGLDMATQPPWATLLAGCAMEPDITRVPSDIVPESGSGDNEIPASITYRPVDAAEDSLTLRWAQGGIEHLIAGARGNVRLALNARAMPRAQFEFLGRYQRPAADADWLNYIAANTWDAWGDPASITRAHTPKLVLGDGVTHANATKEDHVLESLELDLGNQIAWVERVGRSGAMRADRTGSYQMTIETPANDALVALYQSAESDDDDESILPITLVHGRPEVDDSTEALSQANNPGETLTFKARCQIREPAYSESAGVAMMSLSGPLVPSGAGRDDLTLTAS